MTKQKQPWLPALISATCLALPAGAAPTLGFSSDAALCASACSAIGGVALTPDEFGFLVIDEATSDDVPTYVVIDAASGTVISATPLGDATNYTMTDIAADGTGEAWMIGWQTLDGVSVPGRWHSSDVTLREVPLSFDGNTDLSLLSVATDGAAFGVTNDTLATRIAADGTATNLAAGLTLQLPTSVTDSNGAGTLATGNARLGGLLTLAVWDGPALVFQDTVTGGNGVIGGRENGDDVLLGLRVPLTGPELGVFVDPSGSATYQPLVPVGNAELFGMDRSDAGFAFGSVEGSAALIDLNDLDVTILSDVGVPGFESLVSMARIQGEEWLFTLDGPAAYLRVQVNATVPDTDDDGIADDVDNCQLLANPDQVDGDGDLIGNRCDADFNNDCIVNVIDLGILRTVFFTPDATVDMNVDGVVNVIDLGILRTAFFQSPGPGAPGNACAP